MIENYVKSLGKESLTFCISFCRYVSITFVFPAVCRPLLGQRVCCSHFFKGLLLCVSVCVYVCGGRL